MSEPSDPGLHRAPAEAAAFVPDTQGRETLLSQALARWQVACERLQLSPQAGQVAALLLVAELDAGVVGESSADAATRRVTRGEVIAALRDAASEAAIAAALAELEQRGVVVSSESALWMAAAVQLVSEVLSYCLCDGHSEAHSARNGASSGVFCKRVHSELEQVRAMVSGDPRRRLLIAIRGRRGSGRDTLVELVAQHSEHAQLRRTPHELREPLGTLEPQLSGATAVWDARGCDVGPEDGELAARWLEQAPNGAVVVLDEHQDVPHVSGRHVVTLDGESRGAAERTEVWSRALIVRGVSSEVAGQAAHCLARRSRAGAGLAARALERLVTLPATVQDLVQAAERSVRALAVPSEQRGVVVEQPVEPLSRLVVSPAVATGLSQLLLLARRFTDFELTDHPGVRALFYGPSGTGKTLSARAIAAELKVSLFRVDLSAIVSKWLGETERNLREAFEASAAAGAILLFDEGDALLSRRSEVARGSDRYANLEVSYLLQAMQAHDGIVIATTNLLKHIDAAFIRRFDVAIEFPPPTLEERRELWRRHLGEAAAALEPEQWEVLCRPTLTGGNIASASRLVLTMARERGCQAVSELDLCEAIAAEFRKMGSTVQAAQWAARASSDVGA